MLGITAFLQIHVESVHEKENETWKFYFIDRQNCHQMNKFAGRSACIGFALFAHYAALPFILFT